MSLTPASHETAATGFAAGTPIATDAGFCPVELLREGDKVITRDRGALPVRWAGAIEMPAGARIMRIPVGAMDNDADLLVPGDHRMLWTGWQVELLFCADEALVCACDLVGMNGIGWSEAATDPMIRVTSSSISWAVRSLWLRSRSSPVPGRNADDPESR